MHDRQQTGEIVFIASEPVLTAWSAQQNPTRDVIAVSDADPVGALTVIGHRQPRIVVLEQGFACTRPGAALIQRLQTDPAFTDVEVRLLPPERVAQMCRHAQPMAVAAVTQLIGGSSRLRDR